MKAIILAAGLGQRLMPLTADKPKGMVCVNQTPILENILDALYGYKDVLSEVVIVLGYKKEKIIEAFGYSYNGLSIAYVYNDKFDSTNNIYSLALSTKWFNQKEDVILFESDVFFEHDVLHRLMREREGQHSIAVIDTFRPGMDGTVVKLKGDYICELVDSGNISNEQVYKTVNIYYFNEEFFNDVFIPMLTVYMNTHSTNHYYEIVLKAIVHLDYYKIKGLCINTLKWYEIDDAHDLKKAEFLFKNEKEQLSDIRNSWGGYWNYDLVDYNFICNSFFPGEQFCKSIGRNLHSLLTAYPSSRSNVSRKAAAAFNQDPDQLLVCNGASEAIKLTMQCFERPVVVSPNFGEYSTHPDTALWSLKESDRFQLDVEGLQNAVSDHNYDAVVITNPNNPTSIKISTEKIQEFLDALPQDVSLILDTSFEDFATDCCAPDPHRHQNLLIIKSLGKTYGLPGIRLGYLKTANKRLLKKIEHLMPIWNVNSFAEFFFENFIKFKKAISKSIALLNAEKALFIRDLEGIRVNGNQMFNVIGKDANFLFCRLHKSVDVSSLSDCLYSDGRIVIKDCTEKVQPSEYPYVRLNVLQHSHNQTLLYYCERFLQKTSCLS